MITLEDINSWEDAFSFPVPVYIDLRSNCNTDLYTNDRTTKKVKLKFNYSRDNAIGISSSVATQSYLTQTYEDGYPVIQHNNNYNTLILFPVKDWTSRTAPDYLTVFTRFEIKTNTSRLLFSNDTLANRKFYIKNYAPSGFIDKINGVSISTDSKGDYVPLSVITDGYISAGGAEGTYSVDLKFIYEPPMITVNSPVYIGNNNQFSDVINCPAEYTVYYNNKPVTELFVPEDTTRENIRVKVVTKSRYPYVPTEKWLTIPVEYKSYTSVSDLSNYTYLKLDSNVSDEVWNVNSKVTLISEDNTLTNVTINNDGLLVFNNVGMQDCIIHNNNSLTIMNSEDTDTYIVNNGDLTISDGVLDTPTIINNQSIKIINNTIVTDDKENDLPILHSSTDDYTVIANTLTIDDDYTNNSLMFIRAENPDKELLLKDNTFTYDATLTIDNTNYTVSGNGLIYGLIDDDTLYFYNLEVNKDV